MVGAFGSADPVTVRFRDWSNPPRCDAVDADVAGEAHAGVDLGVDPGRQRHVDLAGVEVDVDLATVQRRAVSCTPLRSRVSCPFGTV